MIRTLLLNAKYALGSQQLTKSGCIKSIKPVRENKKREELADQREHGRREDDEEGDPHRADCVNILGDAL